MGWAVGLVLAAAQAVDLFVRLHKRNKVIVASTLGSSRRHGVVLTAVVVGVELVLASVEATRDLDITLVRIGVPVHALDEAGRQDVGIWGRWNGGVAEGDGAVRAVDVMVGPVRQEDAVFAGRDQSQSLAVGWWWCGNGAAKEQGVGGDSQGEN